MDVERLMAAAAALIEAAEALEDHDIMLIESEVLRDIAVEIRATAGEYVEATGYPTSGEPESAVHTHGDW